MSARWALPFLAAHPDRISKAILIAPSIPKDFSVKQLSTLRLPVLLVWGEHDKVGRASSKKLKVIPGAKLKAIKDAAHTCYLEQSKSFNLALLSFLQGL